MGVGYDRLPGTRFGGAAVDQLAAGSIGRMVTLRQPREVAAVRGGGRAVESDGELVATGRGMGIELDA